jgi:hypothetical protein
MSTRPRRRATQTPTVTPNWVKYAWNAPNTWWVRPGDVRVSDAAALDLLCERSVLVGRGNPIWSPDVDRPKLSHPKPGSPDDCLGTTQKNALIEADALDRVEGVIVGMIHPGGSQILVNITRLDDGHLVTWRIQDGNRETVVEEQTHATTRREAGAIAMTLASRTSGTCDYTYPMLVTTGDEFKRMALVIGLEVATPPLTRVLGPERSRSAF